MRYVLAIVACLFVLLLSMPARAAPPAKSMEDALADGDIDAHDLLTHALPRGSTQPAPARRASWITVAAFTDVPAGGTQSGWGAMAIVGLSFDKIAQGPSAVTRIADGPAPRPIVPPPPPSPPPPPPPPPPPATPTRDKAATVAMILTAKLARSLVAAAWRAAGLSGADTRIDGIADRARKSALLPETRLRALTTNDTYVESPLDETTPRYYDATGQRLTLEARLTWRLDKLLYADDEPTFARLRLDTMDARAKVAGKALDALFEWQRARIDEASWAEGTREHVEATLRRLEAESSLDVLTAGWFSSWLAAASQPN